ncbi:hypothetical protein [Mesorhizobium sp.]|uniref:flavodoxin family protein n=1 Tax=Mesorhizobium sp. TaxID=1871066 RepID=UPI001213BEBE|nr:hypothetical protein [Mesorhizobium sp.]TIO77189.1 MAG: flavodoxin family protein [Mesorhizobium sp.]
MIVVYSRTGNTLKVAKALAGTLGAEIAVIRCQRNYEGAIGFLRGVVDSVMRHKPLIDVAQFAAQPHDLMVIAGPIWAGRAAAPVMAFLAGRPKLPGRVALLLTHGGSNPAKALAEVEALVSGPLAARLALKEADIKGDRFSAPLGDFARKAMGEVESHLIIGGSATRVA